MLKINNRSLGELVKNELMYRGDLNYLQEIIDDIEYLVDDLEVDQKTKMENKLVQLVINSR